MTAKKTLGRRFSKREVEVHHIEGHETHFETIDWDDVWGTTTIERHRQRARKVLESEGVDVQRFLDDSPYGSLLRDYVLNSQEHDPDSLAGLAARIFELCSHVQAYKSLEGGSIKIPGLAYRLGRLVMLSKAYEIESSNQSARARNLRKPVTKQQLRDFRDNYEGDHGTLRGWKRDACRKFRISGKTLNGRMAE